MSDLPMRKGIIIVIKDSDRNILVCTKTKEGDEVWQLPSGGIERDEKPEQTFYREVYEEMGLEKGDVSEPKLTGFHHTYVLPEDKRNGWPYRGQSLIVITSKILDKDKINLGITNELKQVKFASYDEAMSLIPFKDLKDSLKEWWDKKAI